MSETRQWSVCDCREDKYAQCNFKVCDQQLVVAEVGGAFDIERERENANIMAAAPELLECCEEHCKQCVKKHKEEKKLPDCAGCMFCYAIAKARTTRKERGDVK